MKKLFAIAIIAAATLVACENSGGKKDKPQDTLNTTTPAQTTDTAAATTPMTDTTAAPATDTTKK